MFYAKILNNQVVEYPYTWADFVADNNNTNYGTEDDILVLFPQTVLATEGYTCVEVLPTPQPQYDWITQGITEGTPEKTGNLWYQVWTIYSLTPEQISVNEVKAAQSNKAEAESLLQATDWTATVDINNPQYSNPYLGNQDAFLSYRSQVRQIAVNPPIVVTSWPTKPQEVWVDVPAA